MEKSRELLFGAWHTAIFSRMKTIPELNKIMPAVHNKPDRAEQIQNFRALFAAHKLRAEAKGGQSG